MRLRDGRKRAWRKNEYESHVPQQKGGGELDDKTLRVVGGFVRGEFRVIFSCMYVDPPLQDAIYLVEVGRLCVLEE